MSTIKGVAMLVVVYMAVAEPSSARDAAILLWIAGVLDPSLWFYYCAICDTSAHLQCVLGRYPFMKPGKIYPQSNQLHQHDLIFVKKIHYCFRECFECGDPCEELALECINSECRCIVHWKCVAPSHLTWYP
ncbi:hypothetical protein COLO4_00085 [Corchorus olitorius]|uniref:Uncharacterized protein n=1 Tax=Corchorus olitorius TaxID=93759 RepID=A0A1R3L4N7_9ROSI|nr:hypothetical protein COLO4_00085 [Corchorus olitorius]